MSEHRHDWKHIKGQMFGCRRDQCQTVSDLATIIANAERQAELRTQLDIYTQQLFDRDLKKSAHDKILAWVRQHNPEGLTINEALEQGTLL